MLNEPLLMIFNQRKRSLGEGESSTIFMKVSVDIRNYLNLFTPSSWIVFTCISLMTDEKGWCFPNIETLSEMTGIGKDTVITAIRALEAMNINGSKVLLKVNKKIATGRFANNRYLIFPSPADIELYADDNAKQSVIPILTEETKTPVSFADCITIPNFDADTPMRQKYEKILKLYEEGIRTKKKLVTSEGSRVNNVAILNNLIMQIHGKQWKQESSRISHLIKLAGNHWKLLDAILASSGVVVKGNPGNWIEIYIKKNGKNLGPNTTTSITSEGEKIVLAPGETYSERLEVLASLLENNDKFNLWRSVENRESTVKQIEKIKELL